MNTSTDFTINAKLISLQFEKPYVAITEEDAVKLECLGCAVKRVTSDRFGPSQQVAVKFAPAFRHLPDSIAREHLQIGGKYVIHISPYHYNFNGKTGVSLQANFMTLLPRESI